MGRQALHSRQSGSHHSSTVQLALALPILALHAPHRVTPSQQPHLAGSQALHGRTLLGCNLSTTLLLPATPIAIPHAAPGRRSFLEIKSGVSAIRRKLGSAGLIASRWRRATHLQDVAEDRDVLRMQDLLREHARQLAPNGIRHEFHLCLRHSLSGMSRMQQAQPIATMCLLQAP